MINSNYIIIFFTDLLMNKQLLKTNTIVINEHTDILNAIMKVLYPILR